MAIITATELMVGNLLLDKLIDLTLTAAEAVGKTDEELLAMIDATNVKRKAEIDTVKARNTD